MSSEPDYKPDWEISRGVFTVRQFTSPSGSLPHGGSGYAWCELKINGKVFQLPSKTLYFCSLSPLEEPSAATLRENRDDGNLYLLYLSKGEPVLMKLNSGHPPLNGYWLPDGHHYLYQSRLIDIATGKSRDIGLYRGEFLAFSPDQKQMLSYLDDSGDFLTLNLKTIHTDKVLEFKVKRTDYSWLLDETHKIPGSEESAHI